MRSAFADPDVVAQNYAAATAPGIQSCTKGYGLLSGDVGYGSTQIKGQLPYSLNYRAPLRQNLSAAQSFEQPEESASGWTDNYDSHVITQTISTNTVQYQTLNYTWTGSYYNISTLNPVTTASFAANVLRVRLPGESSDTVFKEQNGVFSRLYSADAIRDFNNTAIQSLPWSSNLGEYSLSRSGSTLNITKNGIIYAVASPTYTIAPLATSTSSINIFIGSDGYYYTTPLYWPANQFLIPPGAISNTAPYIVSSATSSMTLQRVSEVTTPNGHKLTLAYDANVNLTQVSDNRSNVLTFEHNYNDPAVGTTQTVDESRLVTKVTLTSGTQGDTQVAVFGYATYNSRGPRTGAPQKVFSLISSSSPIAGSYTYTNQMTQIGATATYVRNYQPGFNAANTPDSDYYYPVLTKVINSLGQVEQQWNITQNYVPTLSGSWIYSTAKTTIESLRPGLNGTASAMDMTTTYDDVAKTITMTYSPDGFQTATATVTTTINSPTNVTISTTGVPCLSIGGKPISSAVFNTTQNQILNYTDARGYQSVYTYDTLNRVLSVVEASGTPQSRTTTYTYSTLSTGAVNNTPVPNTVTAPLLTVTNTINARGQITKQVKSYPGSSSSTPQTWLFYYYENTALPNYGLLYYYTGPSYTGGINDLESWTYDIYGNVASHNKNVNNSSGTVVNRQTAYANYNSAGLPLTVNYPDVTKDTFTYNANYRVLSTVHSRSTVSYTTSSTYDTLQRVISTTDADGKVSTYGYDGVGRPSVVMDPSGNTTTTTYFPNGQTQMVLSKNAQGVLAAETEQSLKITGQINATRQSSTNRLRITYTYDANGNVTQTQSTLGIINSWTYDPLNRVISHTDGNGKVDTKAYDVADNNTNENAANSAGSTRGFIQRDVLQSESNTDFGQKTYTYDPDNRLIARGHVDRSCSYGVTDQDSRPQKTSCTSTASSNINLQVNDTYTYDLALPGSPAYGSMSYGNLDKVTANNAGVGVTTSYIYDLFHRLLNKTQVNQAPTTLGYTASQQKNSYTYTMGGKLTSMTYPSGSVVNYAYDTNGVLNGVKLGSTAIASNIIFDGASRLRGWTWGTASGAFNVAIDDGGLTTGITNTNSTSVNNFNAAYIYDIDGRMTKSTVNTSNVYNYTYDNNSQLLTESLPNASKITYTYDTNGNRLTLSTTGTTGLAYTAAGYGYTGNKLTSWTKNTVAQTLGLSSQGEIINSYKGTSTYDNAGRRKLEGAVPGNSLYTGMSFDYNHLNERTFRRGSNLDRQYAYDESSHLIGEYTGNGALIVEYVWLGDRPIAAVYPGNRIVYIVTDYQNKPRRAIDAATQLVVWSWDPDAFGVLQPATGLTNGVEMNLRFPGQYYDVQTGLYYNHNRYYNPELGRYMEPDPIGLEGGLNPYAYCSNNPVSCVDPTGLYGSIADGTYVPDFSFSSNGFAIEQQRTLEQAASRITTSFDLLGAVFPKTMSNFARDPNYASALNQSANLRQITTRGASFAALAPYPSALMGTGILGASAPVVGAYSTGKAAAIGAATGSGLDGMSQIYNGANFSTFNYQQNIGVGVVGALTGVYGTSLANGAMVAPPSIMKLGTLMNPAGFWIFANQFMLNQAGSRAVKSGTSR